MNIYKRLAYNFSNLREDCMQKISTFINWLTFDAVHYFHILPFKKFYFIIC